MDHYSLGIARMPVWLSRLAADEAVAYRFLTNPVVFSSWYALVGEIVDWPGAVHDIRAIERAKKLSFERTISLLTKVNYSVSNGMDVEYARRILEGYAVHAWVVQHFDAFKSLVASMRAVFDQLEPEIAEKSQGPRRLPELVEILGLSPLEEQVLVLSLACSVSTEIRTLFEQLSHARKSNTAVLWTAMFACEEKDLATVLAPKSNLRMCGLLESKHEAGGLPSISNFWAEILFMGREPLVDLLTEPLVNKPGTGIPARLTEEDLALAAEILQNGTQPGVNLLLYGADGMEKRAMLHQLVASAGKRVFRLQEFPNAWGDLSTVAFVAQRALFQKYGQTAVLVIDRPSDVLERKPSGFLRMLLGIDIDSGHIAPFDEMLLESNPAPTVWTGAGADTLPEETIGRFVFHAPLQKARREERRAQLEALVLGLKLTKKTTEELLRLEEVSALQLNTALRAAKLSGASTRKEREAALLQAVRRSLKALKRDTRAKEKECVTEYSLKYLNCGGKFGPEQILKALTLRPRGAVCLYGPPGTGKTQFVEHLAATLGRRLIAKRASDLLSKFVGENEQNIAKMFAEAEGDDSVLFLDEGDSFLRDRNSAHSEWEVTKVNELLQQMERFEGIFIVATNLFRGLDAAALRRFTFKLEFNALSPEQRWDMFVNESGLKGRIGEHSRTIRDKWFDELVFMPQLTAGDFATVKRQIVLLGETLTPDEWIGQLRIECAVKSSSTRPDGAQVRG